MNLWKEKTMKKKLLAVIMMAVLALSVTACGGGVLDIAKDVNDAVNSSKEDKENDTEDDVNIEDSINDALDNSEEVEEDTTAESEGTLTFTVPEGFVYDESSQLYNSPDYLGNINYLTMDNDGSFNMVTKALMEMGLESQLTSQFGSEVDITVTSWEDVTVDGYEAIRYSISYELSGISVVQTQIIINGTEKLHYLTFTEMNNSGYADEFAACEETMKFE